MTASYLDGLEMLEKGNRRESFQLSPDLLDQIHYQWMKGALDDRAIVMHRRADLDEVVARIVAIKSEVGQGVFPGVSMQTPILFTNTPKDFSDCPEGKMFLGVGDIGFNEHNLPSSIQGTICCADMTAKYLKEDANPTLTPPIEAAKLDDLHAKSAPDSLAQTMKRAYRLGESTESVVGWATERLLEWHENLIDKNEDHNWRESGYEILIIGESFPDLKNNPKIKRLLSSHNPDSLMTLAFRSYGRGKAPEKVREWIEERVRQWEEDLYNSQPETLWPELLQAGEQHSFNVIGFPHLLNLVVIRTENLINQKYAEYVARFARWRKGWNAAVVIQVNKNGNTQIFPNNLIDKKYEISLDLVAADIISQESKRWHFQFNTLLNGSWKHDQPPTKFTPEQLMEIVKKYAYIAH